MDEVKHLQPGTQINQQAPERLSGSPFPSETFLYVHTWHTKYPKTGEQYSLEFDVKHTGIAGIAWTLATLITRKRNPSIDLTSRL